MKKWIITLIFMAFPLIALASGAGEAHHADEGHHGVPAMYVVSLVVNLVIFVGLLYMVLRKAASNFFATRSDDIREKVETAEKAEKEAKAKIEEYGKKLDELSSTREEVMDQYRKEAAIERDRIIERATETAKRIRDDADRALNFEMSRLKDELRREVASSIVREARTILSQKVTEDDRKRLLENSIADLKEVSKQ